LTEAQLPPHDHGSVVTASRTTSGEGAGIFNAGSGVTEVYTTGKTNSGDGASASHGHAGSTVDLSAVDIDPAWYALAYIMKI
jgi:hypothetical protein